MKTYAATALSMAATILICAGEANAREVFRECGPNASGVIFVNGTKTCIGGNGGSGGSSGNRAAGGNAGGIGGFQRVKELNDKRERLARRDCGFPPEYRDYGLERNVYENDKLATLIFTRDTEKWRECVDRVMRTKYPKEEREIKTEMKAGLLEAFPNR